MLESDTLYELVFSALILGGFSAGLFYHFKNKRLQQQHHTQLQLLHNSPMGLCFERKGHVTINKTLCLMWNISHKPHTLNEFLALIAPEEKERFLTYYAGLTNKKLPFDSLLKRNNQLFYVRGRAFDKKTHILWITDISAHQEQLIQLKEKHALLTEKEMILEKAWEALPLPIFIHQGKDKMTFANLAANQSDRDLTQLHWVNQNFTANNQEYTLTYGLETRTEEEVQSMFREVGAAHQRLCQELPCAVCLFNAKGQLMACSAAFAKLWDLDEKWLKAPQDYENFWDTLQEKGLLSRVVDFAQYKKAQREQFSKLSQTEEVFLYLPGGRIIRRLMIPFAQGGVILLDEDKTS